MVVTDPTIDPITGLPVLNPSGPVQQIPLGQEVFPYADLNATAQPTRGPIYGDDIIPTSALLTAPDKTLKPRSIRSTTTRDLYTREAVFQNLGAAIPDGETAPVDVNVVSGGGGGSVSVAPWQSGAVGVHVTGAHAQLAEIDTVKYITFLSITVVPRSDSFANRAGTWWLELRNVAGGTGITFILATGALIENDAGNADAGSSTPFNFIYNPFLDPSSYMGTQDYSVWLNSETFSDYSVSFAIDYVKV